MINVTKTYLPSFDKYTSILKKSWDKAWVTNNGELVQSLEQRLKEKLLLEHLYYCTNGTIVLQMALKALDIKKEVITTPFSYVATVNALLWEGCTPVFADINDKNFCIDVDKIESLITPETQAILATHVYGYPCDVEKIEAIASKYGLSVIYDGAHAFGCTYKGRPLLSYGDISTCSFHATKIFHTVEGGSISTNNEIVARKLFLSRQFGHVYDDYFSPGINAKNSEFHAAMGLCVLDDFEFILSCRKKASNKYDNLLKGLPLKRPVVSDETFEYNFSYYPIVFTHEEQLLAVQHELLKAGYGSRRYFYPSLNTLPFVVQQTCPVSELIAKSVLCLPLFHDIEEKDQEHMSAIIHKCLQENYVGL